MPPIELVRQRTDHDCVICCLAMHTNWRYEQIVHLVGDAFDPAMGLANMSEALTRLGFISRYEAGEQMGDFVWRHRDWCISPEFFRAMAWGRSAIITVPSLNSEGGWHAVYWDGVTVWDPSTKKTYRDFSALRPHELVLFRTY